MERKGVQVIKDVVSKTAGLVFFSLLAIALGVVFGVMFERWVGGEPGTPTSTSGIEVPIDEVTSQPMGAVGEPLDVAGDSTAPAPTATTAKYRVRVGPYPDFAQATKTAEELRGQGYPVYLADQAPFLVQVGAFANRDNALALKAELAQRGYTVAIQPE